MSQPAERTRNQIRWQRNKAGQRARQLAQRQPAELAPDFVHALEVERMKRGSWDAIRWAWNRPELNYWTSNGGPHWLRKYGGHWHAFAANVWAAIVELEAQLGPGKATPTRISRHLAMKGWLAGYKENTARIRVNRARATIIALEQAARNDPNAEFWLPFHCSNDDAGSN